MARADGCARRNAAPVLPWRTLGRASGGGCQWRSPARHYRLCSRAGSLDLPSRVGCAMLHRMATLYQRPDLPWVNAIRMARERNRLSRPGLRRVVCLCRALPQGVQAHAGTFHSLRCAALTRWRQALGRARPDFAAKPTPHLCRRGLPHRARAPMPWSSSPTTTTACLRLDHRQHHLGKRRQPHPGDQQRRQGYAWADSRMVLGTSPSALSSPRAT